MEGEQRSRARIGRVRDCRALGRLYSSRGDEARKLFHPFPEGRFLVAWVFLALLSAQRIERSLVRLYPPWGFLFVVHPGTARGTIDGFAYMRVRRRTSQGLVANIGTLVAPQARGRGLGPELIATLILEARKRGVYRIETEAYEENAAARRMGKKLGFRAPDSPSVATPDDPQRAVVAGVLDLGGADPHDPSANPSEAPRPTRRELPPEAPVGGIRRGKLSDFRVLGRLYSSRDKADREMFHPFPEGRFVAALVFFALLSAQRFYGLLVRLRPKWGFLFVVEPGDHEGTITGFAYLRIRRKAPSGYVGNIGTLVGPQARGKGLGPRLHWALLSEARRRGVVRIETGVYVENSASMRMCEKLGFRDTGERTIASPKYDYRVEAKLALDLDDVAPGGPGMPPPPSPSPGAPRAVPGGSASTGASPISEPRSLRRDATVWAALLTCFALITYVRLALLLSSPYPPSGDIAEQLYWSHIWLGTAFPSVATVWWIPPVYIFTIYIPFTHLFPLFTGQELLMGVVPALLVFPTYLLLRESDVNRPFSLFGASFLALAPSVSLMVSWNAGYNLFGMFWALVFFAGLAGTLRTGRRSYLLLAAVGFGLTAGTHYFTFAFLCLGFALIAALALLLLPRRAETARRLGWVLGGGLLFAAPFALVYFTLIQQTGNVGGAITLSGLETLAQQLLPFSTGGQALWSPLIYLDAVAMLAGIAVLVATRLRKPETPVLLGILLSGITLSITYPQEADRGLYFVPLGLYPIVAIFFQFVYEKVPPRAFRASPRAGGPKVADPSGGTAASDPKPRPAWPPRSRRSAVKVGVAFVVSAAFLLLNAQQSLQVMSAADQFYAQLTPQEIPVLNWLAHNTSKDAAVYSASPLLEPWIWGYANRQAFAPTPLNLEATTLSYQATYLADLATLGQYVVGDPYLAVAQNSPSPIGEPLVFLRTAYEWDLLLSTGASNVNFTVTIAGQVEQLSLGAAQLVSNNSFSSCTGCSGDQLTFTWPGLPFSIVQQTNVSGESMHLGWSASGGQIDSVSLTTYLVPSSFGAAYLSVLPQSNVTPLTDEFAMSGDPLTMTLTGDQASFQQTLLADGWTMLVFNGGPELTISFQGLDPYGSSTPYTADSGTILSALGVSYIVTDYNDSVPDFGYLTYLRCVTPNEFPGVSIAQVFQSGSLYVFKLNAS